MATVFVSGTYTVAAGETLTLSPSADENAAVILSEPTGGKHPEFLDNGKVVFTATDANDSLIAFNDGESGDPQGLIKISKGASFTESSTGAGSYASGYISDSSATSFENDGTFSITAAARAFGLYLQDAANSTVVNAGTFTITGDSAYGLKEADTGLINNSGDFEVHGVTTAVAMELGDVIGGSLINSGTIDAQATSGSSIAISIDPSSFLSPLTIDNSGTITGQEAIAITPAYIDSDNPGIDLTNTGKGTINGDIDLGVGPANYFDTPIPGSDIVNAGAINGAIHFSTYGTDTYDGSKGTLTGAIYLGAGVDTVLLGNDGETVHVGAGTATITGGAGNDTVVDDGAGAVTFSYAAATSGVAVDLYIAGAQNTGGAGTDTLGVVHGLIGSAFDDVLTAGAGAETLDGGAGDDTVVFSGPAQDYLINRSGGTTTVTGDGQTDTLTNVEILRFSDEQFVLGSTGQTLTARPGGDVLFGGPGDDTMIVGTGADTIQGNGGNDTAVFSGDYADYAISQTTTISVVGDGSSATLDGVNVLEFADRQMVVGIATETLTARAGGDTLIGGINADTFVVGSGADAIDGGQNTDTAVFSGAYANYQLSQSGPSTIVTGAGGAATLTSVEILQFSDRQMVLGSFGQILTARAGGDTLAGGAGDDVLYGAAGDDTFIGGGGNDRIYGGGGTNTAVFSGGYAGYQVVQNAGSTTVTGGGATSTLANVQILQFADAQMLLGTSGGALTARAAGDTLIGTSGNDTLTGGAGADTFIGGAGADTIDGGGGNDTVVFSGSYASYQVTEAAGGVVTVKGADGTDTLTNVEQLKFADQTVSVSSLASGIVGTSGADTLNGTAGNDTIYGLAGNDTLKGAAGNDILDGGPGNDVLNGGAGVDTASYADATSGVTVSLLVTKAQATGGAGTDTLTAIENLTGSSFNDTLTAANSGSVLQGLGGDDTLVSGAGNDTLDGGAGNNTASYALAKSAVTVSLELSGPQKTGGGGTDTLVSIQNLIGSNFNDTLTAGPNGSNLQGGAGNDVLVSGPGNDSFDGGAGVDTAVFSSPYADYSVVRHDATTTTVTGPDGTDFLANVEILKFTDEQVVNSDLGQTLTARAGGDILVGNQGADHLNGGAGNDVLIGNSGNDVLNGGAGYNTAIFNGDLAAYTIKQNGGTTTVKGPDGTDTLTKVQVLQFEDAQVINSSTGAQLVARSDGDKLVGGAGADHLVGGPGNDVLIGGGGQDTLTGGGGQDSFVFSALADSKVATPDLITDWHSGDQIDLSAIDADTTHPGVQLFHFGATPGHIGDIVATYDAAHNRTVVDLYVNADTKPDAEIWLAGNQTLNASDFVL